MKSCGIVAEYNPFHNGHQYQLKEAKEQSQADVMIAVMSGSFLQRGEPAIVDKWRRATYALNNGADIVIELPVTASVQPADLFGEKAVQLLDAIGVSSLSFGTDETTNFPYERFAERYFNAIDNEDYADIFDDKRQSYPQQMMRLQQILFPTYDWSKSQPNHQLALSYAKANHQLTCPKKLVPIDRIGSHHHDGEISHQHFASGTALRKGLKLEKPTDVMPFIPNSVWEDLQHGPYHDWILLWPYLKYRIETSTHEELRKIYQMVEGLEYKFKQEVSAAMGFDDFIQRIKSKRYTYTRLQRLCVYVLLNITKEEIVENNAHPYIRLLGMTEKGRLYLKEHKKEITLPIITNVTKREGLLLATEIKASRIYQLGLNRTESLDFYQRPRLIEGK
ncbi:nucleotidyltransferase [Vagococcus lutrae]|uniref:nucleotidyltransferase n=1 Tax=Vagococcus lutrae TaxID=81947 RepID=UPI002890A049|nr:nucleotidyltransferase [Vagococcus lutrae]MDT2812154.1 nucleotidyltransferase [Vagococcus lutrae]